VGAPLGLALGYRPTYTPETEALPACDVMRKKRFYFVLLVLVLILPALPGFAAKAAKRAASPVLRFA
jgi:hypothetical protein